MKKALERIEKKYYYYDKDGKKIEGEIPPGIRGDLSGIRGNLTHVRGNLSGVWGDLNECEITDTDRRKGIDVKDLIKKHGNEADGGCDD